MSDVSLDSRGTQAWWDTPKGQAHVKLPAYIDNLLSLNNKRFNDYVRYAGIYGNFEAAPVVGSFLANGIPYGRFFKRITFNVTQSMVETVANQKAAEFGSIRATSVDGDFKQFMIAKQLTQALQTEFKLNDVKTRAMNWVRDALVFGNGLMTVYKDSGLDKYGKATGKMSRPVIRRQFTPEVVVDPYENVTDGYPHVFSICRYVSRQQLIAKYPEWKSQILTVGTEPSGFQRIRGDDNVRVDESFLMARGGNKGRHVACITGATFFDDEYDYEQPPFAGLMWVQPFQGWYAQGLVDQLMGTQLEINELLEIIHQAQTLFAHPFMLIEASSNVNLAHIQDVPGRLLKYTNTQPEIKAPMVLSPEIYQHLDRCYQKAYEIAGINPFQAQAKTLPRLESSKAMRMSNQMGDERHFSFGEQVQKGFSTLGQLYARVAVECAEEGDYLTRLPHSAYFKSFSWKDANFSLTNFNIELDTDNPDEESSGGKMADIQNLAQLGQITPDELAQAMDNPDIERIKKLVTASSDYIDYAIHCMTVDEKPMQVDPFCDKTNAMRVCVAHWLIGERLGWPSEAARQNLMNFILELKEYLAPTVAQTAPGSMPLPPTAPANPLNAGMPTPGALVPGAQPAAGGQPVGGGQPQ